MSHQDIALRVEDLCKRYGRRATVLTQAALLLPRGSCTLLTGENGAGKSTLMRILAGLERPDQGRFQLNGSFPAHWRKIRRQLIRSLMYLHQQPYLFDGSVEYNLEFVLKRNKAPRRERKEHLEAALDWAGMTALRSRPAHHLSGGERQRLALARAWLGQPDVMLLDEPTANLDREARRWTLELLQRLNREGMTLVITSHDPAHFAGLCHRRLHLEKGTLHQVELEKPTGREAAKVIPIRRDYA